MKDLKSYRPGLRSSLTFLLLLPVLLLTGCSALFGELNVDVRGETQTNGAAAQPAANPQNSGGAATGQVDGMICYPGELGSGMHLYFIDEAAGTTLSLFLLPGELVYSAALPSGRYQAFAWPDSPSPTTQTVGGYTQAVLCGLGEDCTNHTPVVVDVQPGQQVRGVHVCDWSVPADSEAIVAAMQAGYIATTPVVGTSGPTPEMAAYFSPEVDSAAVPDRAKAQRVFSAGIQEVYAIWDYHNMQDGQRVRRVWLLDGSVYLDEEVVWDGAHYGSDGTVNDVSISKWEHVLPYGKYELMLYIDGEPQLMGGPGVSFEIAVVPDIPALISPDGSVTAHINPPAELVVTEGNDTTSLFVAEEMVGMTWLPDSRYLLFSTRNRANQIPNAGSVGVVDTMWIADVTTADVWQFAGETYNLHDPQVSPSGRYVAAVGGSSWGDACFVDRTLWFFDVDGHTPVAEMHLTDFAGLPDLEQVYVDQLLGWQGSSQFDAVLGWTCTDQAATLHGTYRFDLANGTVVRVQTGGSYTNKYYRFTLSYPAGWVVDTSQDMRTPRIASQDGFLDITGMGGASLDEVTAQQAGHKLMPYGPNPTIEAIAIQGHPARIVRPAGGGSAGMVSVIIALPYLSEIDSRLSLLMLSGDAAHIQGFIDSLVFDEP